MKNPKSFSLLLFVICSALFTRCTPENLDYISTAKETISRGQWSVEYYFAGQDKTDQFTNYQFSFSGNGTVSATDGNNRIGGTWSMLHDVNRNEVLRMNIQEAHFQELSEEWKVNSAGSNLVTLKEGQNELRLRKL